MGASPKGDSTPLLVMKGVGLPGVTTGWIQGEGLPSTNEEDPDAKADEPGDVDPIVYNGIQREVIGIDPLAYCPMMEVELTGGLLRRCTTSQSVSYTHLTLPTSDLV